MAQNDYAFLIGVTDYKDFNALHGPVEDAKDFLTWLNEDDKVPKTQIFKLLSKPDGKYNDEEPEPTYDKFFTGFYEMVAKKNENPDGPVGRRAYFYFAGHGFTPSFQQQSETALLLANAKSGMTGMSIPGMALVNYCEKNGLFEEIVLVMDCCRTDISGGISMLPLNDMTNRLKKTPKRFIALAAQPGLPSREGSIGAGVRGYFTVALMEGLRGAAAKNKRITGEDLRSYIINRLPKLMPEGKFEQEPQIDAPKNRNVVFTGVESLPIKVTIKTKRDQKGHKIVLQDGVFNDLFSGIAGQDKLEFTLTTGMGLYLAVDTVTNKEVQIKIVEGDYVVSF